MKTLSGGNQQKVVLSRWLSLTDLDDGNLKMTTDFRSVYATMLKEWMGFEETAEDREKFPFIPRVPRSPLPLEVLTSRPVNFRSRKASAVVYRAT